MIDEVLEANTQWIGAQKSAAERSSSGFVVDGDGWIAAWPRTQLALMNAAGLTRPVHDHDDFERRVNEICAMSRKHGDPWALLLCHEWFPGGLNGCGAMLASRGLEATMDLTGMVCHDLLPPRRPEPAAEYRHVMDYREARHALDLNSVAYGMDTAVGASYLDAGACFSHCGEDQFGVVAYVGGEPVSTATTQAIDGCLYVLLVATHPNHQRKGHAEAVLRRSLGWASEVTGLTRTVLHASAAGEPIYFSMGYRRTSRFRCYMCAT